MYKGCLTLQGPVCSMLYYTERDSKVCSWGKEFLRNRKRKANLRITSNLIWHFCHILLIFKTMTMEYANLRRN